MSLLPDPTIEFHFHWDAPHYGPACTTYGHEALRAHASHISVSILPDGENMISVEGMVVTQKGLRDRRHSVPKLCRPDSIHDDVWVAIGESIHARINQEEKS